MNATTSYDEVTYKSYAFAQSHPMRLGAMATLFGMNPKPVDRCRVLELGCAAGGNIIPMAEMFPESEFVGTNRRWTGAFKRTVIAKLPALAQEHYRC